MPLFTLISKLDDRRYSVDRAEDNPRLIVSVSGYMPGDPPPPAAYPSAPAMPIASVSSIVDTDTRIDLVRAFEEGRLSHPTEDNPYKADKASAWSFGRAIR